MRMEGKGQRAGTMRRGGIVEQRGRHGAEQKKKNSVVNRKTKET